jgi:hypothetical protein
MTLMYFLVIIHPNIQTTLYKVNGVVTMNFLENNLEKNIKKIFSKKSS